MSSSHSRAGRCDAGIDIGVPSRSEPKPAIVRPRRVHRKRQNQTICRNSETRVKTSAGVVNWAGAFCPYVTRCHHAIPLRAALLRSCCAHRRYSPAELPEIQNQEIDTGLKIGYAVLTADINGDKKPDIVVVDQHKVVWYENPTLEEAHHPRRQDEAGQRVRRGARHRRRRAAGTRPRRGVEAGRHRNAGQRSWLKRGKSLDDEWTMHELPCDEPTVHRVRAFDIDGDGKPEIVHVPLQGAARPRRGTGPTAGRCA